MILLLSLSPQPFSSNSQKSSTIITNWHPIDSSLFLLPLENDIGVVDFRDSTFIIRPSINTIPGSYNSPIYRYRFTQTEATF